MDPSPSILCVDDEPANLSLLDALLAPRGFRVLQARDGQDALAALAREHVDLVLLDVMMPVMDGFAVCRGIKGDDRTRGIPVVLLTALSGREDRIQGIESGADDFISKPFDKAEVLARIQMLLKVKALNEQLKGAYDNILGLVAVGGELIRAFSPLTFDFRTSVDAFVAQIVRRSDSDFGKAEIALVGFPAGGDVQSWRMYKASGGKVAKAKVDLDIPQQVLLNPDSRLVFYNLPDLQTGEGSWLSVSLKPLGTDLQNAVCYLSPDLFVLLLNFGKEVTAYDATVLDSLVTQSLFLRSLAIQVSETENAFAYTVQALARAAEANDRDTGNHIQRLGEYCAAIAEVMGLPQAFVRDIRLQAQMHDVGKIHIHPDILGKKGDLTPQEWAEMQKHTLYGAMILGEHPRFAMAKNLTMSHHEKWDGSGYPFGLKGEEIPLEGRIVGIADQYDALRSARSYKAAFSHETTVEILTAGEGRTSPDHFDPRVLAAFKSVHQHFAAIFDRLSI